MARIVQKFGGTSVGSIERIQAVAKRVLETQAQGHEVLVVVSAMSGETNRLVDLARAIQAQPESPEYDLLIASGEQVSVGLTTLAINSLSPGRAEALLGFQIGLRTDSAYSRARIRSIDRSRLESIVKAGKIPVIAGFQGVDDQDRITTLGRGGSDTSAVAIAAAVDADDCEIYTDVTGVFTTDPRICPKAKKIPKITYEEMLELAGLGAKVLQIRSVELAAKFQIPLHVRSSFNQEEGTRVVSKISELEQVVVSGVAADKGQTKISISNFPPQLEAIFEPLATAGIVVDVIVHDLQSKHLHFTVPESDAPATLSLLKTHNPASQQGLSKVSIVGVGMQHHPGVAAKMFSILSQNDIRIHLVTTSEIKITCLLETKDLQSAVRALHSGFDLE